MIQRKNVTFTHTHYTINFLFIKLHFHPLEVVSRYRDPQLQLGDNHSYLVY